MSNFASKVELPARLNMALMEAMLYYSEVIDTGMKFEAKAAIKRFETLTGNQMDAVAVAAQLCYERTLDFDEALHMLK